MKKHIIISIILGLIAAAAIGGGVYYYLQYQQTQQLLKNPTLAAQVEQQTLVNKVGRLIDLPKDEQPTIATVADYKKLKDQPFFSNAKNGDKALIYTKAKEAILYDPNQDKIIEVGPVSLGTNQLTATPVPTSRIALYNGTSTVGLTNTVEKQIITNDANIEIVSKTNANRNDYTKTLVVDVMGNQSKTVSQLAQLLHGEVAALPTGETKPDNTDIVVILGNSK